MYMQVFIFQRYTFNKNTVDSQAHVILVPQLKQELLHALSINRKSCKLKETEHPII